MRTTLTLDPDNAVRLERLQKERSAAFKEVVNDAIRRGLDAIERPARAKEPFQTPVLRGTPAFKTPEELKALINEIQEEEDLRKLGLK